MMNLLHKFKRKKDVLFISYACSGATLLENIFIELGIRLKFEEEKEVGEFFKFNKKIDKYTDQFLKTDLLIPSQFGLPSVANNEKFNFRNDIAILFSHSKEFFSNTNKTLILVRDPRDTLWSKFKMNSSRDPKLFFEYSQSNINSWIDFYSQALTSKNLYIVRFEDIKLNPFFTLRGLMSYLGLAYENERLNEAINCSTFTKTKEVEDRMIQEYPEVAQTYFPNRITKCGQCYQYKLEENASLKDSFLHIENEASDLILQFGYKVNMTL